MGQLYFMLRCFLLGHAALILFDTHILAQKNETPLDNGLQEVPRLSLGTTELVYYSMGLEGAGFRSDMGHMNFTVIYPDRYDVNSVMYFEEKYYPRANPFGEYKAPLYDTSYRPDSSFLGYVFAFYWKELIAALALTCGVLSISVIAVVGWKAFLRGIIDEGIPLLVLTLIACSAISLVVLTKSVLFE